MWKAMIDGKKRDERRRLFIHTTSSGDLYFDQDYNIRWTKQRDKVLKIFHGGAITQLKPGYGNNRHYYEEYPVASCFAYINKNNTRSVVVKKDPNIKFNGKYTLGGLYSYALDYDTIRQWNNGRINAFFGAEASSTSKSSLKAGRIELLALHLGLPVDLQTGNSMIYKNKGPDSGFWWGLAYALQTLMPSTYNDDVNIVRGKSPESYLSSFNVTHQLYHIDLRWSWNKDYSPWNFWYVDESYNW